MKSTPQFDHDTFARRHRGGMLLERHGIDLYLHPFLGFTLAPGLRTEAINTDEESFRLSDSPFGTVDSERWLAAGGGGILLGNSVAFSLAASNDSTTMASQLAHLTGTRQLNLGLCAAVSLQELVVAVPFLHAASTITVVGGGPDFVNLIGSLSPAGRFGTVSYERTFDELTHVPMFDLATLAAGKPVPDLEQQRRPRRTEPAFDLAEVGSRTAVAAQRRLRDLAVLARAARDDARIVFCLQPLASTRTRRVTPEEQARYDFSAPVFGMLHSAVEEHWDAYAELFAKGCAELGVTFVNLAADRFEGDSFADTVHFTDHGNRQAAELIRQALDSTPPVRDGSPVTLPAAVTPVPAGTATGVAEAAPVAAGGDEEQWLDQLVEIVTESLEIEPGELTRTGSFVNDYGADSMLVIDILARVEQDMDVRIPDAALAEMTDLEAVIGLVKLHGGTAGVDA
ncbi:phosphopantetheine-binding protein [Micromonospora sp. RTGN7]|uniref:phosphopantetheine-binding protein n=1 Tax=Micromonospora sp. RTGN7 TaxID=3016526 RepID=UPI0029FEE232|nr:phosphopantetheine-binding protein [Micromonospora sp. RTGN7]